MNEQRMQFAIGVVALVSLIALATIVLWFGDYGRMFQAQREYYVVMDNALGAEPGMPVRRAGIRIGQVRKVEYDDALSKVGLTIVLEGDNMLRVGDEPALKSEGILGDTYLDVAVNPRMQGKPNRPPIPSGSTLEGRPLLDFSQAVTKATDLAPAANQALQELQKASNQWAGVGERANRILDQNERRINIILQDATDSIDRLNTTLGGINNVLDPQTQQNLRETVANVRKTSEDLGPLVESSRKAIEQITSTTQKLDDVAGNLQRITKPLAERSDSTIKNLDESVASLNVLLTDLSALVRQFRTQDGTIQRLMRDPAIYQNLQDATSVLADALAELQPILENLSVFTDKIARHPGELGVQGVISRDSGLKEIPPGEVRGPRIFHR
jgi:phospholipid/cholesterol/gamma-HCH transport system substrate-binding protein